MGRQTAEAVGIALIWAPRELITVENNIIRFYLQECVLQNSARELLPTPHSEGDPFTLDTDVCCAVTNIIRPAEQRITKN